MRKNFIFKNVIFFCLIAFLFIAIGTNNVIGKTNLSFKFSATPNSDIVVEGEIIKINLKISDINAGEEGINTVSFRFTYDENFFEDVSVNSKNNWSITYNDEKDNKERGRALAILLSSGITKDQEIGEITLKVKKNLTLKTGTIKFTEVSTNNGTSIIKEEDKTININLKEVGSETNTINKEESFDTNLKEQINVENNNSWIKFVAIAAILIVIIAVVIVVICIIRKKSNANIK